MARFYTYAVVEGEKIPVNLVRVVNPFKSRLKHRYVDNLTVYEVTCPAELVGLLGGSIYQWYPKWHGHQCFFYKDGED